jgi:mono/diheme cytochrome c family protein
VVAGGDTCHSEPDAGRFGCQVAPHGRGKGRALEEWGTPGTVFAPNVTPDKETGIGNWSDGEKIRAIREGVGREGRALSPIMPYRNFRYMPDDDGESLAAYLNTLEPLRNRLPATRLGFLESLWVKGDPRPAGFVPPVDAGNPALYGEYLATLASCEDCHTRAGGGRFGGGRRFVRRDGASVVSANISPDIDTGIGLWSRARFRERFQAYRTYLGGRSPEAGPERFTVMPWLQFAEMTDADLDALSAYLRTRVPVRNAVEKRTIQ